MRIAPNNAYISALEIGREYPQWQHVFVEPPVKIDEFTFQVESTTVPGITNIVDGRSGLCECKAGQVGKFCKHSAAVHKHFEVGVNQMPSVTMQCRAELALARILSSII